MLQQVETARRRHVNRSGRWSEIKRTPAMQGRGGKDHFYQSLILAYLRGQGNA